MRIATWNVNSLKARMPRVEEWLAYAQPDVLCMQETKLADAAFPAMTFQSLGYESAHHGGGRWNGVAILSKVGLENVQSGFSDDVEDEAIESRILWAECGGANVCSVYVPNGRALDDPHYQYKLAWLKRLRAKLDREHDKNEKLAICGDFNIVPADIDVWDPKKFVGATHVSEPERAALGELFDWGLADVFREHYPTEQVFSYWDYRAGDFHNGRGMRIDLILGTEAVNKATTYAVIDRNARKGTLPSDHAPVFIDADL